LHIYFSSSHSHLFLSLFGNELGYIYVFLILVSSSKLNKHNNSVHLKIVEVKREFAKTTQDSYIFVALKL